MQKEFSYLREGEHTYPLIDIKLSGPKKCLTVKALVDSGATFSIFQPEIAKYLGIPIRAGKIIHFQGIAGGILGYLHKVPMKVNRVSFDCYIAFSPELETSFNILGRNNFFLPFLITFNEKHKKVLIETNTSEGK